ncbi:MAG: permease prefix domain 1-containing protein [Armatimonadota bacterium]
MHFLTRVEKLLDIPPVEKKFVMRELKSHYFDLQDELIASGMSATEAADEAEKRLGSPEDVAARLAPVHNSASWRSALLAAVPFLAWGMISLIGAPSTGYRLAEVLTLLVGTVMIVGSMRELQASRRPIWLATWLAGALITVRPLSSILLRISGMDNNTLGILDYAFQEILIAIIMLAALWRTPKWRVAGIALCAIVVFGAAFMVAHALSGRPITFYVISTQAMWLAGTALLVLFAMRVFMLNDYGSAAQATLFMLAWCTVFHSIPGQFGTALTVCSTLMSAAIMVFFARVSNWQLKIMAALAGLTTYYSMVAIHNVIGLRHGVVINVYDLVTLRPGGQIAYGLIATFMIMSVFAALPVCFPIILERLKRRRDRIEIAQ